ncbi:hypothetical protein ACFFLM_08040 [Deinococcus oregonensis]|uniref:Uncharacterized protein n=1 Tax=Deinococcus oregonensis TaxID=1805970 RepID=A0ABV6AWW9_9DEIO
MTAIIWVDPATPPMKILLTGRSVMFDLENLDSVTRNSMVEEIELDISQGNLYRPERLSPYGAAHFHELLLEAARSSSPDQLAAQMARDGRFFNSTELRSNGVQAKVPSNAANILAEGEFNRYYLRGLAARAIAEGIPFLEIYRARESLNPRVSSEHRIGEHIPPGEVLTELRKTPVKGQKSSLIEPGSGLSFRVPE